MQAPWGNYEGEGQKKEEEGGREREKAGRRKGRQTDFRRKGKTRELI